MTSKPKADPLSVPCDTCAVDAGTPCRSRRGIDWHRSRVMAAEEVAWYDARGNAMEAVFQLPAPHRMPEAEADGECRLDAVGAVRMAFGCVLAAHDNDAARLRDLLAGCEVEEVVEVAIKLAGLCREIGTREDIERQALAVAGLLPEATA